MEHYDILIVGGGAAGISAAKAAGNAKVLLVDRKAKLGGVLLQCTHRGFGANQSGIEYAAELISDFPETVKLAFGTTVLSISKDKTALLCGPEFGRKEVSFSRLILATGCREIPMGALPIAGTRPRGIYTAGQMQELMNLHDFRPEGPVVILGSGDIGLIMARRMTLEGAQVQVVAELMPYSGGLKRNIVQCLDDFGIPLKLSHTVVDIKGKERVEGITLAQVENGKPIPGTEEFYECDTLLLSCGLIPENELSQAAGVSINPIGFLVVDADGCVDMININNPANDLGSSIESIMEKLPGILDKVKSALGSSKKGEAKAEGEAAPAAEAPEKAE